MVGMGLFKAEAAECMNVLARLRCVFLVAGVMLACAQPQAAAGPPENVNVWHNALFAGDGAAGAVVNGGCDIHGSAHILGGNLLPGDVALSDLPSLDLSGTGLMRNNCEGIPGYFADRVPPLEKVNINGTDAETLHAKLRIKKGLVSMNGNTSIGTPYTVGSPVKQQMDGTYVNDGWTGNQATPTPDGRGLPSSVYSDNGWNERYDCGNLVAFPLLSDDWRDPGTGARQYRSDGTTPYTYEEYFTEVLVGDPANPTDGIYTGNMALNVGLYDVTQSVYWNATTNTYLTGAAAVAATPNAADDYLKFDASKAMLWMNGQIKVVGSLTFAGMGNTDTINYSGRCAIMTTGDVNIDVKLLTCNNGVKTDYANSFPQNNCLGIMSKTNVNIGLGPGASQLDLVGAFYAQGRIRSEKLTRAAGTMVASYFDMGSQVPSLFEVPVLADNLPLGMLGDYPILLYPAPGNVSATDAGTDRITWTWKDNSLDETGFKVWSDPGAGEPDTLRDTLPANATAWQQTGLTANTLYTFQVAGTNPSYDTARSAPCPAWTLAAAAKAPVVNGATATALNVTIDTTDGNPAETEYLLRCQSTGQWVQANGSLGAPHAWKTAADWGTVTVTGLSEGRKYYFAATARNGAGKWSAGSPGAAAVTLDVTPPTGTIVINGGAPATGDPNVTLSLTWFDPVPGSGVNYMRFSDDGAHWSLWEPLAAAKPHLLPGPNGYKTVRVQFRDGAGNYSAPYSDYIYLNVR